MTEISNNLKATLAYQIAKKLDVNDKTTDDKISGSVWNAFVEDIGTGNTISQNGFISVKNAINSITTYLVKKAGSDTKALAEEWLQKLGGATTAEEVGETQEAEETERSDNAQNTKTVSHKTSKQAQIQKDYNSIKFTVPPFHMPPKVTTIYKNREEGKKLHDSLKQGNTTGLTSGNVAYAFTQDINFGPHSKQQAEKVFGLLVDRMYELNIFEDGKDYLVFQSFQKLPYAKQNSLLHQYRNRVVTAENNIIRKADAKKAKRGEVQKTFNQANRILAEVVNFGDGLVCEPQTKTNANGDTVVRAMKISTPDGKYVYVEYEDDDMKNIESVTIYSDANSQKIIYSEDSAYYNLGYGENFDVTTGTINPAGYDFDKIKAFIKKM